MTLSLPFVDRASQLRSRQFITGNPVRVLYIVDSLWGAGGAEMCLLRLTQSLPPERFSSRILTFHSNEMAQPFRARFNCPIYHWQLNNIRDLNAFTVGKRLYKLIQDERIDIVHTFFQTADLWAAPIARLAGAKVIISSRRDMGFLRSTKHRVGYRLLRSLFTQVQAVSDEVKHFTIATEKVDPRCIITIHNGIETSVAVSAEKSLSMRNQLCIPPDAVVVSCVANVRWIKGIDVLLQAAALVHRQAPEVRFIVVGHNHGIVKEQVYCDEVSRLHESLGTGSYLYFTGHTDQVDVLLKASDIFVLPSRSEGLSNALLEAMRAGLPCVATAVGGNPEVVIEGTTGLLVSPDRPGEMADSILRLIGDSEMRRRMGAAGKKRISQKFSVEAMTSAVMAQYDSLLESHEARPHASCARLF